MKAQEQKSDILGQPIELGCYVAVPRRNSLLICKVVKITPKMIQVESIRSDWRCNFRIYPQDAVRLDGPDALAYILKAS